MPYQKENFMYEYLGYYLLGCIAAIAIIYSCLEVAVDNTTLENEPIHKHKNSMIEVEDNTTLEDESTDENSMDEEERLLTTYYNQLLQEFKREEYRLVLGLSHDCFDENEYKRQYRRLARQYHPDRFNTKRETTVELVTNITAILNTSYKQLTSNGDDEVNLLKAMNKLGATISAANMMCDVMDATLATSRSTIEKNERRIQQLMRNNARGETRQKAA